MKNVTVKRLTLLCGTGFFCLLLSGFARADELFDTKASDAHFQEGLKLYFNQQYQDAIKQFEEAVKIDPENTKAYYHIGYSYYKLKNMPKAMETFEQTYRLDQRYTPIPRTSQDQPEALPSPDAVPSPETK